MSPLTWRSVVDALAGAAVDRLLQQRHEQQLRQQEGRASTSVQGSSKVM